MSILSLTAEDRNKFLLKDNLEVPLLIVILSIYILQCVDIFCGAIIL